MLGIGSLPCAGGERYRCLRRDFFRKMGRRIGNIPGEVREAVCGMRMGACDDGIGSRDFLETGEGDFGGIASKSL